MFRLVYASESNIALGESGVDLEVGRILTKSKRNNPKRNIGGVLYYGDGHFFQVLEGDEAEVKDLYQTIAQDVRHQNPRVLLTEQIDEAMFGDWSMHLVPARSQIRQLMLTHGFEYFKPFEFSNELIQQLMVLLSKNGDIKNEQPGSKGFFNALKRLMGRSAA